MTRELLKRHGIVKKTTYHPRYPIATIFSTVKELLQFYEITGTLNTHLQSVNIAYVIIHRTGKFGLDICGWNIMTTSQKTWVKFKQLFSDGTLRTTRITLPHRLRRRNTPREHGARCGIRTVRSLETNFYGTCLSCGKPGAKHSITFGHEITADAGNNAVNTDATCCSTTSCTSRLWRLCIPQWTHQLLRLRRTRCAAHRKLARWTKWSGQQWYHTLLLDSRNMCFYDQIIQDPGRKPQEGRGVVQ